MVKKLKMIFDNLKKVMGGISASQRLTLIVGAVLIFTALTVLVSYATKTNYEVLANVGQLDVDARQNLMQYLSENKIRSETEGQVLMVEEGKRQEIIMNLSLDGKLAGTVDAFKWLDEITPINTPTPGIQKERLRISRARELEGTINSLRWVKSSKVTITIGADNHVIQGQRHPTKASVNIKSRTREIEDRDVKAVRSLMTFAVPHLKVANVGIVIDGTPYIFKEISSHANKYDEWTSRKIALELQAEDKIKGFFLGRAGELGLVRQLRVNVHIELDRQVIQKNTVKTLEDPLAQREQTSGSSAKGKNAPLAEAGVFSNNSVAQNNLDDTGSNMEVADNTKITEYRYGKESEIVFSEIPGAIKNVQVALVFDEAELLDSGILSLKEGLTDSPAEIQKRLSKYKKHVANSLGIAGDDIENNISVDAMKFANETIKKKAGLVSVLMDVLEKSGGHFLLFGLSLFGFLYFVNVLRQAFDTPELEEEMDEDEIKRRTTDEDVARMLDAQAESLDDIRARHIEERVRSIVKEDPDSAGSLIQRWLLEDGEE